jgi:redox-sensing transcriptional repressor
VGTSSSDSEGARDPATSKAAPKAVIGRVSLYLRQLESFQRQERETVSSSQLGAALGINDAQVRKDLAFFGQFGHPGRGYPIEELINTLRHILGIDRSWPSALFGLGNLGRALLRYRGFRARGFHLVALFDTDPKKIGATVDGLTVRSPDALEATVRESRVDLAILCVPAESAQRVADQVVSAGITGILNFAPTALFVPPSVSVVAVDLSVQLEHLAYRVLNASTDIHPAADGSNERRSDAG